MIVLDLLFLLLILSLYWVATSLTGVGTPQVSLHGLFQARTNCENSEFEDL
jgi:hypothetical protein